MKTYWKRIVYWLLILWLIYIWYYFNISNKEDWPEIVTAHILIQAKNHPNIIRDSTDDAVYSWLNFVGSIKRNEFWPIAIVLDQTNDVLPREIKESLKWKVSWEIVVINHTPNSEQKKNYNLNNLIILSWSMLKEQNIPHQINDIITIWSYMWTVKEIKWSEISYDVIVDLNPWDTYMDMIYTIQIQ